MMASTCLWAETRTVSYLYPVYNTDGDPTSGIKEWKSATANATVVENASEQVTWGTAGQETWYVVTGTDVQLAAGAICNGAVHLILADGSKLTATGDEDNKTPGIQVSGDGNSLTIYGQISQSGELEANGGYWAAGIGGGAFGQGTNITINGGMITANGGEWGAGIGGGFDSLGTNITLNGGNVTANGGGNSAAGIGGGNNGSGSNITINGGIVKANGTYHGAGIGGGDLSSGSDIIINDGDVTANGGDYGAGIGGVDGGSGSDITIKGGTVTANGGYLAAGIGGGYSGSGSNITIIGGNVTANGGYGGAGIGGGANGSGSNIKVATTLSIKADGNNPPTTPVENNGGDIAESLAGKVRVTIIDPIVTAYVKGKTDALGTLGTEQNGPALIVTDNDGREIILYNPTSVRYIKMNGK